MARYGYRVEWSDRSGNTYRAGVDDCDSMEEAIAAGITFACHLGYTLPRWWHWWRWWEIRQDVCWALGYVSKTFKLWEKVDATDQRPTQA